MKPNWFDWWIYKWFWKRWNPILRSNHKLRRVLLIYMLEYEALADKGWYEFVERNRFLNEETCQENTNIFRVE